MSRTKTLRVGIGALAVAIAAAALFATAAGACVEERTVVLKQSPLSSPFVVA